jgi:hypothetical protein
MARRRGGQQQANVKAGGQRLQRARASAWGRSPYQHTTNTTTAFTSSGVPQPPPRPPRTIEGRATAQPQPPQQAAQPEPAADAGAPAYPYNAGEGERKQKATIEHIFKPSSSSSGGGNGSSDDGRSSGAASTSQAPWAVGWQMSERNLVWNDDLKIRLIRVGSG